MLPFVVEAPDVEPAGNEIVVELVEVSDGAVRLGAGALGSVAGVVIDAADGVLLAGLLGVFGGAADVSIAGVEVDETNWGAFWIYEPSAWTA